MSDFKDKMHQIRIGSGAVEGRGKWEGDGRGREMV